VSALTGIVGRYLDPARVLRPSPVTALRVAASLVSARRRGENASLPSAVGIDVSDVCNLSCHHCSRVIDRDARRVSLLPLPDFRDWFAAMRPRYVLLAGYGEPLLNPALPEMVAFARQGGSEVGVVTNGTLLDPKLSSALVKAGLSKLKVSLEAVDPELYAHLRTGARLEVVLRNVKRLRELAGRQVAVELQLVIFEENRGQVAPLIRLCKERFPGVKPHFLYLFTYGGQEGFAAKALRFGDPDTLREIDEGIALATASGFPRAVDSLELVRAQLTMDLSRAPCIVPWVSCLVSTDGDLYPCCHHSVHGRPLGNLGQSTFADLWNGTAMMAFRVALARDRAADPVCARCGFHDTPVWNVLHPLAGMGRRLGNLRG
jgi:radical SAM protein with 4Fe4S-binding SPASM domain